MLKLIYNAPQPLHQVAPKIHREDYTPISGLSPAVLLSHYQEIAPNLYAFKFYDVHHELSCEINLELKSNFLLSEKTDDEDYLVPVLTGEFPSIDVERLQRKVPWDDYLHVILVIRFHLKILEQLLLFCKEKDTVNLILTFEDANLDYMEVFRHFVSLETQIQTTKGEQTEIVIPCNGETYGALLNFMGRLGHDFRQNLWRDQKSNPAYRHYLKHLSLLEF